WVAHDHCPVTAPTCFARPDSTTPNHLADQSSPRHRAALGWTLEYAQVTPPAVAYRLFGDVGNDKCHQTLHPTTCSLQVGFHRAAATNRLNVVIAKYVEQAK